MGWCRGRKVGENVTRGRQVAADKRPPSAVRLIFAGPEKLSCCAGRVGGGNPSIPEWIVHTDRVYGGSQFRVFQDFARDRPLPLAVPWIPITANNPRRQMVSLEATVEFLYITQVIHGLIPYARVGNVQAIITLG